MEWITVHHFSHARESPCSRNLRSSAFTLFFFHHTFSRIGRDDTRTAWTTRGKTIEFHTSFWPRCRDEKKGNLWSFRAPGSLRWKISVLFFCSAFSASPKAVLEMLYFRIFLRGEESHRLEYSPLYSTGNYYLTGLIRATNVCNGCCKVEINFSKVALIFGNSEMLGNREVDIWLINLYELSSANFKQF